MKLKNQNVLITGATGGLGQKVVEVFIEEGAQVFALARSGEKLEGLKSSMPNASGRLQIYAADMTKPEEMERAISYFTQNSQSIDALINIAGGFKGGRIIAETDISEWDQMMEINLRSAFIVSKLVMKEMIKQKKGKIVTVAAMAALDPKPKRAAYLIAKAGVIALTQALAAEGRLYNIQANTIAPGIILTEANIHSMPDADQSQWVTPEQIAQTMVFLCTAAADSITGTIIKMPGGI